jgi:DNA repair protein RecO (recombination protein O)
MAIKASQPCNSLEMPIHKTEAIILRRRDFRETSLIIDFYTRECGKISGLLKGVRAEPKKFASNMELFSHNEILFYRGRTSSLHLVSHCDLKEDFPGVRKDLARVGIASCMVELVAALMPQEDPNPEVFSLSIECLREIAGYYDPEKILTIFKIKILALSGFKPHFDSCVACGQKVLSEAKFSLSLGGLLCGRCQGKDTAGRSIFRGTVATIMHIERNNLRANLSLGMNPQIRRELSAILNGFLNFHLEKELKSQRVLNKIAYSV